MCKRNSLILIVALTSLFVHFSGSLSVADPGVSDAEATKLFRQGNYQESLERAEWVLRQPDSPPVTLVHSYRLALQCLGKLSREQETDAFREEIVALYPGNWQLLAAVAESFVNFNHYGYEIAGAFRRGRHRGGGKVMNAFDRDRVRGLQLYWQAYELLGAETEDSVSADAAKLLLSMASTIQQGRMHGQAWQLQRLTDLAVLPDYEAGWTSQQRHTLGAPVDVNGIPVFYGLPQTWASAKNDGERWRWLLHESARLDADLENQVLLLRANFLQSQFGVQTLASKRWSLRSDLGTKADDPKTGIFALATLGENETVAKLATGIKRFELPDEHNHLKLYQRIVKSIDHEMSSKSWDTALVTLAELFENRHQFPKAATYWRQATKSKTNAQNAQHRLNQIVKPWGRFETVMTQPAGQGATVDFRFRNGTRVEFTAQRIDVGKLLTDVKAYLAKNPAKLDWDQMQLENLGHRLVTERQQHYLEEFVARWSLDLKPLESHLDRRITISTPLQDSGAYLLTSKMADGNTTSIVLWLSDTALVKKPLSEKSLYYVADAATGQPVANCNVEFFGFWQQRLGDNRYQVRTKSLAELTDANGLVELSADDDNQRHQWVAIATTQRGRFAYLGFRSVWSGAYREQEYQQVKVFAITDRPIYRPDQTVQFKFWVRHPRYSEASDSQFAAQSFQIEVRDPRNEKVYSEQLIADAYGGLEGEWAIPVGATLGQYRFNVVNHGGGSFRVEEYKKPEFEVTVETPNDPVELGEKIAAKITAKYYFGSPVSSGTVRYKILRTSYQQTWFPPMPWDWLYGKGYWWFAKDYDWYPGWARWGCRAPQPWWFWRAPTPPEIIAEHELPLGGDGSVDVEFDTATAKQLHPDTDHSYQIQVEVVDQSRRTIVGHGRVLVARQPFQVHVWTDRGHYGVGDTIGVGIAARTLNAKPVTGIGKLRLLKIQYKDSQPVETEVGNWTMSTGDEGTTSELGLAELQIKASAPGQYRLSFELTDAAGHTIEGGQVLTVTGTRWDSSDFRFDDLELIPDRRGYQPGDKVTLQINTNRTGSVVLLFTRPLDGVYQPPQLVRLDGKSTMVEIDVSATDMPNFFVEAVTVHEGRVHTVTRELFVPPAKRMLQVEVVPSAEAYLPGQTAKLLCKLTDDNGEPFVGSLALSVYDKAVESIASGSKVPNIREFFWKWRRSHRARGETNLERQSTSLVAPEEPSMQDLGILGNEITARPFARGGSTVRSRDHSKSPSTPMAAAQASMEGVADSQALDSGVVSMDAVADSAQHDLRQPALRENFADTALWSGSVETNPEGIAELELDMPENLTTWKIRVWAMGHGTRVGEGEAEVVTRKNLIVRLQAPRFFVERDEVVLSANVHNYLAEAKQVRVGLRLEGNTLRGPTQLEKTIEIEAGSEQRVDWPVQVTHPGQATIRVTALTDEESDAMQMSFPVYVHGMLQTESFTGTIDSSRTPNATTGKFEFSIPQRRRAEQTRLEVRYTPSLAVAMLDALPYLIDYPYGCTEQTLNRFLPAVITQQTLRKLGFDLASIQHQRTKHKEQTIDSDSAVGEAWKRSNPNPVFDESELSKVVKAGVNRLTEMQLADGGWGWFSGWGERSTPHTTAVVVQGLLTARENKVAVGTNLLEKGIAWLEDYQTRQLELLENVKEGSGGTDRRASKQFADDLDALVSLVLSKAGRGDKRMREFLFRDRTKLAPYSLATLGLALQIHEEQQHLSMVMRNLSQYVRQDDENQTAWLELPKNSWWHWYGSEYETHAYYLKLLASTQPDSILAPRLVKYLLNNRKHATYWNSTRDTALVVEAFADYLGATGEASPELTVEVWIDGAQHQKVEVTHENLFALDNRLVLSGEALAAGRHTVEIRTAGKSPLYYNGTVTNFTLEEDLAAAGLDLKIERRYFQLTPQEKLTPVAGNRGQTVDQLEQAYLRSPLVNLAKLESGDLIEVEFVVDSKNDYEYVLIEDKKAAGFEPIGIRSGYTGNHLGAYVELRDERVSLFVARLARGRHSLSYRLRAEIPGKYSALPTRASAMYAPELQANSQEMKLQIVDVVKE